MSQEEIDAVVGRLVREQAEATRRKSAIDAEVSLIASTLDKLARGHLQGSPTEEIQQKLEPIRKYFNIEALMALLKERDDVKAGIVERTEQLRKMGVGD